MSVRVWQLGSLDGYHEASRRDAYEFQIKDGDHCAVFALYGRLVRDTPGPAVLTMFVRELNRALAMIERRKTNAPPDVGDVVQLHDRPDVTGRVVDLDASVPGVRVVVDGLGSFTWADGDLEYAR